MLADVEERHQQLLHIERMLVEVRDLFVQMSILIDSQQELVDRIEFQAQSATEYVGAGAVDLNSARDKKKKSFRVRSYEQQKNCFNLFHCRLKFTFLLLLS